MVAGYTLHNLKISVSSFYIINVINNSQIIVCVMPANHFFRQEESAQKTVFLFLNDYESGQYCSREEIE